MKKKTEIKKLSKEVIQKVYIANFESINSQILQNELVLKDQEGRTLFFHAVLSGKIDIINWIYSKGVEINQKDNIGWTVLHYAVQNNLVEVSNLLISFGSDVNAQDNHGNSVLWRAVFESKGKGEIISLLILNNANPNLKNNYNISPFELANTISNYDVKRFFQN
jgi:uncharacterized protein